jgi:sulfatase maturation enzyme AslB (radical SAM superfamily)
MNYAGLLSYFLWLETKRAVFKRKYFAEIDVTDNCNLRCRHCYHFHGKTDFKTQELPIGEWEKRFSDLHKSGVRAVLLVGGEPALRPDVLMLADKTFPIVYVITNGTIKVPDEFRHRLFVSVDGSPTTNDAIRGKNSFSRLMENYSGDKRAIINMTLTSSNYQELEEVVEVAESNGFSGVVCNICSGVIDCDANMMVGDRAEIIAEMRRVKALHKKSFLMSEGMIRWYEHPNHVGACSWGSDTLHLDVLWKRRRCFTDNADCSNCGCFAGSLQTPLKMIRNLGTMIKIAVPNCRKM